MVRYIQRLSMLFLLLVAHSFSYAEQTALSAQHTKERNLILILDVKQHEQFFGACGCALATALKDKVAPIIFSTHALKFVTAYFNTNDWHAYSNDNLLLFIPKQYLADHGIKDVNYAGFNLKNWQKKTFSQEQVRCCDYYAESIVELPQLESFEDLSKKSTIAICQTFKKDKAHKWKIYAVGHGAENAFQTVGLNLEDFKKLLDTLAQELTVDFLIYQTCFGGGKSHLRDVYKINQDLFKKFNFPIISGCLTNSVSFGFHPASGVTYKGIFSQLNSSVFTLKKMTLLLKALNELNKCIELASRFHWTNNLLLIRMPHSHYFEPVIDNKAIFKLSALPDKDATIDQIYKDSTSFKCFLIDKPIINQVFDFRDVQNFIIASGISRPKHFVKEIKLPASQTRQSVDDLKNLAETFASLLFPEKTKLFFVDTMSIGSNIYDHVTIKQQYAGHSSMRIVVNIEAIQNKTLFAGKVEWMIFSDGSRVLVDCTIESKNEYTAKQYLNNYHKIVQKHLNKKHVLPFPFSIAGFLFN